MIELITAISPLVAVIGAVIATIATINANKFAKISINLQKELNTLHLYKNHASH